MTLPDLHSLFSTDDKCREYLKRLRWPNGITCPRCAHPAVSTLKQQGKFECAKCEYQFSVTAGTLFHDSKLPLEKWFLTVLLMVESKKGMSANQIKRTIGVSYKTAWYLCHRVRAAMTETNPELLSGTIEVDETYVGGKRRGVGKARALDNKVMALGAIARGGDIRLTVAANRKATTKVLRKFIAQTTAKGPKTIHTDEWPAYLSAMDNDTTHKRVNHSAKEWVRGKVHTNTMEGAFSLFKRAMVGAYHHLSAKHLDSYLDEFEFRYNGRKRSDLFAETLRRLATTEAMSFQKLIREAK